MNHEHIWVFYHIVVKHKELEDTSVFQSRVRCVVERCGEIRELEPRAQPTVTLSEDEFFEQYEPDNNGGSFYDYRSIVRVDSRYIWSIVEVPGDPKDNLYAVPGLSRVNLIGYVLCKKAWTEDIIEAVYMDREANFGTAED